MTRSWTALPWALIFALVLPATSGCLVKKVADEAETAKASVASMESSAAMKSVAQVYGDSLRGITAETTDAYLEKAQDAIYEALAESFAGCVTPYPADDNPATVGATFNCTGTSGKFTIVGTVAGTLTPTTEGLKVTGTKLELSTSDLVVSERPVTGEATVLYVIATDNATVDMVFDVVDPAAGTVHVTVTGVLTPEGDCVQFEGVVNGTGDELELVATVSDFERCAGQCPSAGGSVAVTFTDAEGDATLDIAFDGSSEAQVTSSRGRTFTVTLTCGG